MSILSSNRLLAAFGTDLPPALSKLEAVALPIETVLFEAHRAPRYVHFLTSGIASVVAMMTQGEAVEVNLMGQEGLPQAAHLLGPEMSSTRCFMQVEGTALRMGFKEFQEEFLRNPTVSRAVLRYVQYENFVASQLCACNRMHEVEERLARWLLMVHDRVQQPTIHLTQEFMAEMIGARRSSVTIVAGGLQRAGLIEYRRGIIRVEDREGLENVACECYQVVRQMFRNLIANLSAFADSADSGRSTLGSLRGEDHHGGGSAA